MYSQWLSDPQNEQAAMQAGGYGGAAGGAPPANTSQPAAQQGASTSAMQQQAPAAQPAQQKQGGDVWSGLGQIAAMRSNGGSYQAAPELRPSAFGGQGSDAPQVNTPPPRKGKAAKIAEIVQAVMTYGASKAASQEPNDNQGKQPTSGVGASQGNAGSGSAGPAAQGGAPAVGTGMGNAQSYGGGIKAGDDWKEYG